RREIEFVGRRIELGEEIAACMHVRKKPVLGEFFRHRHATKGGVALKHENLETTFCKIAGAGQSVVTSANHYTVIALRHAGSRCWCSTSKALQPVVAVVDRFSLPLDLARVTTMRRSYDLAATIYGAEPRHELP